MAVVVGFEVSGCFGETKGVKEIMAEGSRGLAGCEYGAEGGEKEIGANSLHV